MQEIKLIVIQIAKDKIELKFLLFKELQNYNYMTTSYVVVNI